MQSEPILQAAVPVLPWASTASAGLPGVQPLSDPRGWIAVDSAYVGQMALREALLAEQAQKVLATTPDSAEAEAELLDDVLELLATRPDFDVGAEAVRCPDGRTVLLGRYSPLATIGRLVQEDFCLLDKRGEEHVLIAAVLCFPASWSLDEKIMRPLTRVHQPVDSYDDNIARRVQRLFDGVRVGKPLWRVNALRYHDPALFAPRREGDARLDHGADAPYLRSEFQTVRRLARTGAVAFGIHTTMVAAAILSPRDRAMLTHDNARP